MARKKSIATKTRNKRNYNKIYYLKKLLEVKNKRLEQENKVLRKKLEEKEVEIVELKSMVIYERQLLTDKILQLCEKENENMNCKNKIQHLLAINNFYIEYSNKLLHSINNLNINLRDARKSVNDFKIVISNAKKMIDSCSNPSLKAHIQAVLGNSLPKEDYCNIFGVGKSSYYRSKKYDTECEIILKKPKKKSSFVEKHDREMDDVINDIIPCVSGRDYRYQRVDNDVLYISYVNRCEERGYEPYSEKTFFEKLKKYRIWRSKDETFGQCPVCKALNTPKTKDLSNKKK